MGMNAEDCTALEEEERHPGEALEEEGVALEAGGSGVRKLIQLQQRVAL